MSTPIISTAAIADDALDLIRHGADQSRYLAALMKAVQLDIEHNQGRAAKDLAGLGQYLAYDCSTYLLDHSEKLQKQLDAAGGNV